MKRAKPKKGGQPNVPIEQCSLSERIVFLERDLEPTWTNETVPQLYDRLYVQVFGAKHKRTVEDDALIDRAAGLCLKHGAAIDMFILANMIELRSWLAEQRRLNFRTTMLTTDKAVERYNRFIRRMHWRYRSSAASALGSMQWIGSIRNAVFKDEAKIAELYIRCNLADDPIEWDDACALEEPGRMWREFHLGRGMNVQTVKTLFGRRRPEKEVELATLKAAWSVCESLRHRLPDRIGFTEFGWPALLKLLRVVLRTSKKRRRPRLAREDKAAVEATGVVLWEPGASHA